MAELDFTLTAKPLLDSADITLGDTRILERDNLAIVSIATPQGGEQALADALSSGWDLPLPEARTSTLSQDTRAIRTSPDQLLLVFPHATPDAERVVQGKLNRAGYTTDQTDSWIVLELSGTNSHAALERLSPVDLSPASFPINASARTVMEHLGVLAVRTGPENFLVMSASSSAASFLHAVEHSVRYTQPF